MNGYVTKFAQENLTWEKSISKNVALEMAFLNNKISFTAEYFGKIIMTYLLHYFH